MVAIPQFETVPYYVGTFVVPVGTYSQIDYAKNSVMSSVAVAYWIQSLSFDSTTPVQTRVVVKSNNLFK